jgi:KUP system potassium uptake protein
VVVLVLIPESLFFAANLTKVIHGGWLPLVIATGIVMVMTTWRAGSSNVSAQRRLIEGPLDEFIAGLHAAGIPRVPGLAVFPHPNRLTTPLALRQLVDFTHVLHEQVAIVSVINENVPHIRHVDRAAVHDLGYADDGIVHISYRVGFNDSQDVPKALLWAQGKCPEVDLDPDEARYFLSSLRLGRADVPSLKTWRKALFLWLASSAANRTAVFHLPPEKTVVMGGQLEV